MRNSDPNICTSHFKERFNGKMGKMKFFPYMVTNGYKK